MKRISNLYHQICSLNNLRLADAKARKGKAWQYGVQVHDRNQEENLLALHDQLVNKTYRTSAYTIFKIYEPKEREIYRLPYYPDRIVHHAVMNILEPVFISVFTADTYSCIKNRGIHAASYSLRKALRDQPGTQYYLKMDIKKFYPSIDHQVLKELLRRKFKDNDLLWLLDEIIDSAQGLPIGNYLSQYLANFFLAYFDHWLKEVVRVKYYFRYADDLILLSGSAEYLHQCRNRIEQYLQGLKLEIKPTWRIAPVRCGIDFVGYVHFHTHTRLRKNIKKNFARMLAKNPNPQSIASYTGWTSHCNANHLTKTLLHDRIQNLKHSSAGDHVHRRQDQAQQIAEHADQSYPVQNRRIQIQGERQRPAAGIATGEGRNNTCTVLQFDNATGDDQTSAGKQIPIHYNHSTN